MLNKLGAKVNILTKYYIIGIQYTILGMQVCKGTCASMQSMYFVVNERYLKVFVRYIISQEANLHMLNRLGAKVTILTKYYIIGIIMVHKF